VSAPAVCHYEQLWAVSDSLPAVPIVANLSGTNVYLYRGTKDACYLKGSVEHSQTFFSKLGAKVAVNFTTPSAHSWPTKNYGTPCGHGVIESCDYDASPLRNLPLHVMSTLR